MRLTITVDQRYWQTPDGATWTRMPPHYRFLERHLRIFDSVRVIARAIQTPEPPADAVRVDGPSVEVQPIPGYAGPREFLRQAARVLRHLHNALHPEEATLLRLPCLFAGFLRLKGVPYGVEVLGDPAGVYSSGVVRTKLHPLYRRWFVWNLRRQCANAAAAGYVSRQLAQRYPSRSSHFLLDIDLPEEAFADSPRSLPESGPLEIVTAGGFDHPVKGHDVLIAAISRLRASGLDARLNLVGDGNLRNELAALAAQLNVPLRFAGQLSGSHLVRQVFRSGSLFALASRSEGKPRALIEAMALGLPAVATNVGGIPEVLPREQTVARDDAAALAAAMKATLTDPARYARLSAEGICTAREYNSVAEWERRREFLRELKSNCKAGSAPLRSHHDLIRT